MIVDASVALKWIVTEADTETAMQLIRTTALAAPELLIAEVANGIWKKRTNGELDHVPAFAAGLVKLVDLIPLTPVVAERALELAIELKHPAYDCFYLALAEQRGDVVVTADTRFMKVCASTRYASLLVGLAAA